MKKLLLSALLLLAATSVVKADGERFDEFSRIFRNNGYENDSTYTFLKQWAKDEPNNAEQIYCHAIYHYMQARPQIEYTDDLKLFSKTAMLPACERFGKLQINNFWIMKDNGNGMEHYLKAHEYYKKALSVQPNNIELYLNLSEFYLWKYETKYATALALDLLDLHKADSTRWTDFYNKPIESSGAIIEGHMNMVLGELIKKNEFSLASILCDTLTNRYPDNVIYRFDKGVILINSLQNKEAIAYYLKMNSDIPNNGNIINALASLYSQEGDIENTRKYATMLTQLGETEWVITGQQLLASMEEFIIDFEAIREWMKDHSDDYKALEKRFIEGDASLTNLELSRIYFGHALTDQCKGVVLTDVNLKALFDDKKYEKCLKESRKILEQHPASIAALLYALMSASNLEKEADCTDNLYLRFNQLVHMINKDAEDNLKKEKTNDGSSFKYYKILWRADENVFVELLPEEERGKTSIFANPGYFH